MKNNPSYEVFKKAWVKLYPERWIPKKREYDMASSAAISECYYIKRVFKEIEDENQKT